MPSPLKKPTSISPSAYRQDVEEFYLLKNIDSSASVLNTTVDDTTDPDTKRRRRTYLRIQQYKNKLSLIKHFCTWIVKLILPKFLTTHPSLFDNLKSLSRNKEFKALRLAMVAWFVFSSSLLTFGYVALHYTSQSLWAAISTWTFDTAADYTYDVSKVTFSGGVVKLLPSGDGVTYTDNDNGATEFGGATTSSVDWNSTSSSMQLTTNGLNTASGTMTSRIIDNGTSVAWNYLAWTTGTTLHERAPEWGNFRDRV